MAEWYFEMMGQPVGPITGKQLLERVRGGDIVADTPVRKDDSQWVPARDVGGLFTAAGDGQAREVRCPYCGEPIDSPPTRCAKCRRQVEQTYELILGPKPDAASPSTDTTESEHSEPEEDGRKEKRKGWLSKVRKQQE
jgi:DNA-directed RNA polymerase subunit RPC12/RpoP